MRLTELGPVLEELVELEEPESLVVDFGSSFFFLCPKPPKPPSTLPRLSATASLLELELS